MSGLRIGRGLELPVDVLTEAVGIVATRGAGKTYTSVVLIEEAHAGHQNNLGSLRSLGLVHYPATGEVAATEVLFP